MMQRDNQGGRIIITFFARLMQSNFYPVKSLGQHFLKSDETAQQIVAALGEDFGTDIILEIGPGPGILSRHLLRLHKKIFFSEIDQRMLRHLKEELHVPEENIIDGDFLRIDLHKYFSEPFVIIGNFPYQISSQILFKLLEYKNEVPLLVGMFQKEMAMRVVSKHGNKNYGVLSVLIQAFYFCEYLFELSPEAFDPPPKVHSAVIRLKRKTSAPGVDEKKLRQVVKAAFNQRRKKLSNALSVIPESKTVLSALQFSDLRAEQLSVEDFILLTNQLSTATE